MGLLNRTLEKIPLRDRAIILFVLLVCLCFSTVSLMLHYNYGLQEINSILGIVTSVILVSATLTTGYIAWKRLEREYEPQVEVENVNAKLEDEEWHNILRIKNKGRTDIHIKEITTYFAIKEDDEFYFIQGHSHFNSRKLDITVDAQSTTCLRLPKHWRAFGCSIIEFDTDYLNDRKAFGGIVAVSPHHLDKFGNMYNSIQHFFDLDRSKELRWTVVSEDLLNQIIPDNMNPEQKIKQEMIKSKEERLEEIEEMLEPNLVTSEKNICVKECEQEIIQERSLIHDFMTDIRSKW